MQWSAWPSISENYLCLIVFLSRSKIVQTLSEDAVSDSNSYAPGWPGIAPRWTSSAKTGIGTSLNRNSRVWFTLSHGILNEVYFPRVDMACTRDLGLIVTDGSSLFSEEKRH